MRGSASWMDSARDSTIARWDPGLTSIDAAMSPPTGVWLSVAAGRYGTGTQPLIPMKSTSRVASGAVSHPRRTATAVVRCATVACPGFRSLNHRLYCLFAHVASPMCVWIDGATMEGASLQPAYPPVTHDLHGAAASARNISGAVARLRIGAAQLAGIWRSDGAEGESGRGRCDWDR